MLTKEQIKNNFDYFFQSPILQAGYTMMHDHFYGESGVLMFPPKSIHDNVLPNLFLLPIDFSNLNHLIFQNLSKDEIIYLRKLQNLGKNALENVFDVATHYSDFPYDLGNDLQILKKKIKSQLFCKNKAQSLYQIDTYLYYLEQYMKSMGTNSPAYLRYSDAYNQDTTYLADNYYSFFTDKTDQHETATKR